jgi:1-acyl-sn-glycerol-3-phosphate acyltransferase
MRKFNIAQSILVKFFSIFNACMIRVLWLGKVEGIQHIPDTPCVIISNHESYLDFLLLGYVLKRKAKKNFRFWAKTKVVNHSIWKTYSRFFDTIEVNENGNYRKLNELSVQALNNGEYVCIFPEGRRSRNGNLQVFKTGYLRLATAANIKVVPAFLENTYKTWPAHRLWPKIRRCKITFHPPFEVPKNLTESETEELNQSIMNKYQSFKKLSNNS